jgi:hypothetical protein
VRPAALLLVLALSVAVARAEDVPADVPVDPDAYAEALAPYGVWMQSADYGRVWRPAVGPSWRPFVDGQWVWSPYGWTWVSFEPWAWTFHYGRWVVVPGWGWVWVPGSVWGPAWVDWWWGDGFVGWAPLAPFGGFVGIDRFVFVRDVQFCSSHLRGFVVDHHLVPDRVVRDWRRHASGPPPRDEIERVSHHPVERVDRRPPGSVAPSPARSATLLAPPPAVPRLGGPQRLGQSATPAPGGVVRGVPEPWRGPRAPVTVTPRPGGAAGSLGLAPRPGGATGTVGVTPRPGGVLGAAPSTRGAGAARAPLGARPVVPGAVRGGARAPLGSGSRAGRASAGMSGGARGATGAPATSGAPAAGTAR